MVRLFIAARLDAPALEYTSAVESELRRRLRGRMRLRWTSAAGRHITLAFLGETAEADLAAISSSMDSAAARFAPFDVSVGSPGVFPPTGRGRVLWLGIDDPSGNLASLALELKRELGARGFGFEKRDFVAHVTLGRSKDRRGFDSSVIDDLPGPACVSFAVDRIILFESRLSSSGSRYLVRHTSLLGDTG